ncbi:hypothetical protein D9757_009811 [Collybiopsis confluens]|uniref:Uncharacterized protein n=1 Tax=Collybiopsis confluens TaxID=2823264 RepID=A0A8H5M6C3_9AGAR|nr:hypothetical protein D9757_009811 [Collybiopsis confluens]
MTERTNNVSKVNLFTTAIPNVIRMSSQHNTIVNNEASGKPEDIAANNVIKAQAVSTEVSTILTRTVQAIHVGSYGALKAVDADSKDSSRPTIYAFWEGQYEPWNIDAKNIIKTQAVSTEAVDADSKDSSRPTIYAFWEGQYEPWNIDAKDIIKAQAVSTEVSTIPTRTVQAIHVGSSGALKAVDADSKDSSRPTIYAFWEGQYEPWNIDAKDIIEAQAVLQVMSFRDDLW